MLTWGDHRGLNPCFSKNMAFMIEASIVSAKGRRWSAILLSKTKEWSRGSLTTMKACSTISKVNQIDVSRTYYLHHQMFPLHVQAGECCLKHYPDLRPVGGLSAKLAGG